MPEPFFHTYNLADSDEIDEEADDTEAGAIDILTLVLERSASTVFLVLIFSMVPASNLAGIGVIIMFVSELIVEDVTLWYTPNAINDKTRRAVKIEK